MPIMKSLGCAAKHPKFATVSSRSKENIINTKEKVKKIVQLCQFLVWINQIFLCFEDSSLG